MRTASAVLVTLAGAVLTALAPDASAQAPVLKVNGVTAHDNNGVAHMKRLTPFTMEFSGTPGAPFAVLLSGEALDGNPGGETDVDNGFFLAPWQPSGAFSPIHPVFDGIGINNIATKLGQPLSDFVTDTPSPLFVFDASGKFTLSGLGPPTAFLLNTGAGANPIVLPLESVPPTTIALYLQIVELNVSTMNVTVGNGLKVIFDAIDFPGVIAYSEATDVNQTTTTLGQRQTPSMIVDSNFADGTISTPTTVGASEFGVNSIANLDFYLIELAGFQPVYTSSHLSNVPETQTNWNTTEDPDNASVTVQNNLKTRAQTLRASGIEAFTGDVPALNNENPEFPYIQLPGRRALFHWRNGSNPSLPSYGFGILFQDTGVFKNLTPSTLGTFTGTVTVSPWNWEVGVTPDGNRALVVLTVAGADRLFILNLQSGAATTATEVTGTQMTGNVGTIFEESISFLKDGQGGWVAFFEASPTSAAGLQPSRLFRVNMQGTQNVELLLPTLTAPDNLINRIDRQPIVSDDLNALCVVAGTGSNNENVYSVRNVTPTLEVTRNVTGYSTLTTLGEWSDALDGTNGRAAMSKDGSLVAFTRQSGDQFFPNIAHTDASDSGAVGDLIAPVTSGGLFDIIGDFKRTRDYFITDDNQFLIFAQGIDSAGVPNDRFDFFRIELSNKKVLNLTRTIHLSTEQEIAFGPWDAPPVTANNDRPTFEGGGSFLSPNRKYLFHYRDLHGLGTFNPDLFDRFNLVAFSVAVSAQTGVPTFDVTNVTGTEFAPSLGETPPVIGSEDIVGRGALTVDGIAYDHFLRRVGGGGAFDTFYYMVGRKAVPVNGAQINIDQVLLFDGNNPGPAIYITNYATNSAPLAVQTGARIYNLIPSKDEPKIAYMLDRDGPNGSASNLRDVIVTDLALFGTPLRIPSSVTPFTSLPTAGCIHFFPSQPVSLVFASGTIPRPIGGQIDNNSSNVGADPNNPIDATAFLYRFDTDTAFPIAPAAPAGQRRGVFVWSVAP